MQVTDHKSFLSQDLTSGVSSERTCMSHDNRSLAPPLKRFIVYTSISKRHIEEVGIQL